MARRALAALIAFTLAGVASAQGTDETPGDTAPAETAEEGPGPERERENQALLEAKELFRRGLALQQAGDCERAVVFFLRSRARVASVPNTLNAANCLSELGRFDEALELLEILLTELRADLTEAERTWLGPEMSRLRAMVGSLEVIAESDADLVVDGRRRGRLPLVAPVRLLPGTREVRLLKSGFRPHVAEIEITAGQTATLRADLEPLTVAGRLAVKGPPGAEVIVDGAPVGTTPWEGVLAPGRHVVQVRKGDEGSSPAEVIVVTGQTATHEPRLTPLGPELQIRVEPHEAELLLDGVSLGSGRWIGRLPVGEHRLGARAEGYRSRDESLRVTIDDRPREIPIELAIDEEHPRWASTASGKIQIELIGGPAFAPSLGSDAETSCQAVPCDLGVALGFLTGARAGYELPVGISFELVGGYAAIERGLTRTIDDRFTIRDPTRDVATQYRLDSRLSVSGGFVGGGLGFRQPLVGPLELGAHLAVGAWFTSSGDRASGSVTAGTTSDTVGVIGADRRERAVDVFVAPEIRLGARFGGFGVGLGLFAAVMALEGPTGPIGDVVPQGSCDPEIDPAAAACAPGEPIVAGERPYGPFALFVPSLSVGYLF